MRWTALLATVCSAVLFSPPAQAQYYPAKSCFSPLSFSLILAFGRPEVLLLIDTSPSPQRVCDPDGSPVAFHTARPAVTPLFPRPSPNGVAAHHTVLADFNGDGVLDIAASDLQGAITVQLGTGTGNRATLASYTTPFKYTVGKQPFALAAADLNGDGILDLVSANNGDNTVSVLLGEANGTFQTALTFAAGSAPFSLAIADVDGDGKPDIVVADCASSTCGFGGKTGGISLLGGNGDGTFRPPANLVGANQPATVLLTDVNGDGKLDIVYGDLFGTSVYVALGTGGGNFAAPVATDVGVVPNFIGYGDFNGDGKPDLAVLGLHTSTIAIAMGQGNGTFAPSAQYVAGIESTMFLLADATGDGRLDLITPDIPSGEAYVFAGNADGSFAGPRAYPAGPTPTLVATGDFNGDGNMDYAIAGKQSGAVQIFLGDGNGGFEAPTSLTLAKGAQPTALVTGDFNRDRRTDLVVASSAGFVAYLGGPNGLGLSMSVLLGGSNAITANAMVAGDFNADGRLDFAVAGTTAGSGTVAILTGDGNGDFELTQTYPAGVAPTSIAAADLNDDGKVDLAVTDGGVFGGQAGGLLVFLNQGSGSFGSPASLLVGANPTAVAAGDLNGDGNPDLIVATSLPNSSGVAAGSVGVLLGNGNGTFQNASFSSADGPSQAIAVADFNRDGLPDVLISTCCGGTDMNLFTGNGDGTLQPELDFDGGPSPQGFAIADFNNDGKPDLVVAASAAGGLATNGYAVVLLNSESNTLTNSSAAGGVPPPLAPNSIVSAYGLDLATGTLSSGSAVTTLLGTTVTVLDSAGTQYPAQIFYVSPKQVNYLMPAIAAPGTATITVTSGDGTVSSQTIPIIPVAPSLFTENADDLAAMVVIKYGANGSQTVETVYGSDSTGAVIAVPIDLGSTADQVYVSLYGTGLRGQSSSSITINGATLRVQFAGAQPQFAGEDQVNFLLPHSFQGSGTVSVLFSADGIAAHVVTLAIK